MRLNDVPGDHGLLVPQGAKSIPAEESRTNTAYGTLATPDRVQGVVLPQDGLILVAYQALWGGSNNDQIKAAIFLHNGTADNQLKVQRQEQNGAGAPRAQAARSGSANQWDPAGWMPLASYPGGLVSVRAGNISGIGSDVTTGQVIGMHIEGSGSKVHLDINGTGVQIDSPAHWGGSCPIFAAAGTYTVSVQFAAGAGSVKAKERKLWVATMDFARSSTLPPI